LAGILPAPIAATSDSRLQAIGWVQVQISIRSLIQNSLSLQKILIPILIDHPNHCRCLSFYCFPAPAAVLLLSRLLLLSGERLLLKFKRSLLRSVLVIDCLSLLPPQI
jgi:hypothetical protein